MIVLTGSADDSDTKHALHFGATSYLPEPPTPAMTEEIIRPQLYAPAEPAVMGSLERYIGYAIVAVLMAATGGLLYLALQ